MRTLTLVLVGPMTGIEDFNYPAFRAAAAQLRATGFTVIDPSENPEQPDWQAYLRVSLAGVLNADAVATLPGYTTSQGARLELHVSRKLGLPEFSVEAWLAKAEFDTKHAAASGW